MRRIISVTEAARRLADCVTRVHEGDTFILLKNGAPVACLAPVEAKVCTGSDLAAAVARAELSREEARMWYRDLRKARGSLKLHSVLL